MSAVAFHACLRNGSTVVPRTPVSGMEWKRNGMEWISSKTNCLPHWFACELRSIGFGSER